MIDVQNLAKLARIDVDATQVVDLEKDIANILEFVSEITSADVPQVEPVDRFRLVQNRLRYDSRPDQIGVHNNVVMRLAPNETTGFFKVPKMINKSE